MIWALLAAFLTRQPPLVQGIVLGLCTGLFVSAAAEANNRSPMLSSVVVLVLVSGVIAGGLFFWGLESQRRHGWNPSSPPPRWLYAVYVVVWLLALAATVYTLFGAGGFKVAVLAIVPLVLLAPTAIHGAVTLSHRGPAPAG